MTMVYPITSGDVIEAIRDGSREGTLEGQKELFEDGSAGVRLYGPNGQLITQANPMEARVRELEDRLGAAVENPAQWTLMDRIKRIETLLESGDAKVQLSGQLPPLYGADISDRPSADEVPVGQQFIIANENLDAWISNGTDWVVI